MVGGLLRRELKAVARYRSAVLNPLSFLFLAVMLFAIAGPADPSVRANYGGAVLWLIVLLTTMLSLDGLFRRDFDNGVLEQVLLGAAVPFLAVLARLLVQWLSTGVLIAVLSPVLCLLMGLPTELMPLVVVSLLAGTPALSLLGGVGAALTVGFSRGGLLLGLLVLPLFLPVLIFGAGAIDRAVAGFGYAAQLYWLIFISMVALCVSPFATLAALKISVQLR